MLLTPLEPSVIEEGLLPVLPALVRHHRVVLASVRDPSWSGWPERTPASTRHIAAAAGQALHRRQHTAELLAALGVDVVDRDAEQLPPALADHYLRLAEGLL
ncbi:MAG: hypothetical protein R2734_13440 [Nocardioides sp.]